MRYLLIITIFILAISVNLFADTVIMKSGKEIKGLVVDEYADRVILSTVDGEKDVFRKNIKRIEYDEPEQNFMQLGRAYDAKDWHDKAAFYYKKAMQINPNYKEAREAYLASHAKMWRQEEKMTKKELERHGMVMDWWKNRYKKDAPRVEDKGELLKDAVGISLVEKDGFFTIDDVQPYSSAAKSGIKKGDLLVGIWGRLIRYSRIEDILDELLGPKYSEVRVLIERDIVIPIEAGGQDLYKNLDILLDLEYEGLVVKEVLQGKKGEAAGFKKGDFVIAIDKHITRYLPLDSAVALINSAQNNQGIVFRIRRKVNLRREGK